MLTLPEVAARLRRPYEERKIKRLITGHQIAHLRVGQGEWRLTEEHGGA